MKRLMAKKSLPKTMILVMMESIILAIFQAQANVLTHPSLCPTSLPIRLLQSSQNGNARRHRCVESTIEKCEDIPKAMPMFRCVHSNFIVCIDPIETRKGLFSREQYTAKTLLGSWKCLVRCFKGKTVAHPHHATCLVRCLEMVI
jgi:hypothetical protein